jgi:hypothetical protein
MPRRQGSSDFSRRIGLLHPRDYVVKKMPVILAPIHRACDTPQLRRVPSVCRAVEEKSNDAAPYAPY